MQAPQRERSRQSVRTRQYCCSSQRLSLLKLCDANPPQLITCVVPKSSKEPGKLPQWGADASNVYLQAGDRGQARQSKLWQNKAAPRHSSSKASRTDKPNVGRGRSERPSIRLTSQ
jgi:hypothetical protein